MEPHIVALITPDVLADVAARYDVSTADLTRLGSFESVVYAAGDRILRLTHSTHRTPAQVNAELEWLDFLARRGLSVARPLPSARGALLEEIDVADGRFLAVTFERARGERVRADTLTDDVLRAWGRLLGKMHALTESYVPSDPNGRPRWDDEGYVHVRSQAPATVEPRIIEMFDAVVSRLQAVPETTTNFGLVHNDAHTGNFLEHEGTLTLFDFDDASLNFKANDLAMALYYGLWMARDDKVAFGDRFLSRMLEGYREERAIGADELRLIPDLMRLRECLLYVHIQRKLGPEPEDENVRRLLHGLREGLLADRACVTLDFEAY